MTVFVDRDGKTAFIHTGPYTSDDAARTRTSTTTSAECPQVRVDPLTGLKSIIAGERADRPGRRLRRSRRDAADRPGDATRSLPGHEDQTPPELYARARDGGAPDTPGWRVRVVPNLYPALEPDAPRRPSATPTPTSSPPSPPPARTR